MCFIFLHFVSFFTLNYSAVLSRNFGQTLDTWSNLSLKNLVSIVSHSTNCPHGYQTPVILQIKQSKRRIYFARSYISIFLIIYLYIFTREQVCFFILLIQLRCSIINWDNNRNIVRMLILRIFLALVIVFFSIYLLLFDNFLCGLQSWLYSLEYGIFSSRAHGPRTKSLGAPLLKHGKIIKTANKLLAIISIIYKGVFLFCKFIHPQFYFHYGYQNWLNTISIFITGVIIQKREHLQKPRN